MTRGCMVRAAGKAGQFHSQHISSPRHHGHKYWLFSSQPCRNQIADAFLAVLSVCSHGPRHLEIWCFRVGVIFLPGSSGNVTSCFVTSLADSIFFSIAHPNVHCLLHTIQINITSCCYTLLLKCNLFFVFLL